MFKVLRPLKDAYITDRVMNGSASLASNVGAAGSLDLYKLYGYTTTLSGSAHLPNTELTRLLVQFDLAPLKALVNAGLVDMSNPSFSCHLHLYDVYGGQPTPNNFTVTVSPLSASFDEGLGRDVVYYSDFDTCNFLTASHVGGTWLVSGCGLAGTGSVPCDYITASAGGLSYVGTQTFTTGEEDLDIDVTSAISATLAGAVPDNGLRVSFIAALENDTHTYFVKRFASRTAFNEDLRPKLLVRFDDSIQDDTDNVFLGSTSYLFLHNYVRSAPANLLSGSAAITGSNSLILQLVTPMSGGTYSLYFTGSQHYAGTNPITGIYSASVLVSPNDPIIAQSLAVSGSVPLLPIWQSLDGTVAFLTGSVITAYAPQRGPQSLDPRTFVVTVLGLHESHDADEQTVLRVNIFDHTSPLIKAAKVPVELPGIVVRDVHYQVRDTTTGAIPIPFDAVTNSTRVSNDSAGMYFPLDMSALTSGHSYVVDVLIITGNNHQRYKAASPTFRVGDLP